jgi:hypothetical protein
MPAMRPTLPIFAAVIGGNLLFERVVAALGFDEVLMRRVVADSLAKVGATPIRATPQDMGMLLPEIERRLLLLAPQERAAPGLARLRRLLLCWDGI